MKIDKRGGHDHSWGWQADTGRKREKKAAKPAFILARREVCLPETGETASKTWPGKRSVQDFTVAVRDGRDGKLK